MAISDISADTCSSAEGGGRDGGGVASGEPQQWWPLVASARSVCYYKSACTIRLGKRNVFQNPDHPLPCRQTTHTPTPPPNHPMGLVVGVPETYYVYKQYSQVSICCARFITLIINICCLVYPCVQTIYDFYAGQAGHHWTSSNSIMVTVASIVVCKFSYGKSVRRKTRFDLKNPISLFPNRSVDFV